MSIRFYPRDIGLWREAFTFRSDSRPSIRFESIEALKEFCRQNYVDVDNTAFPFHVAEEDGVKYVVQWTVIGWIEDIP